MDEQLTLECPKCKVYSSVDEWNDAAIGELIDPEILREEFESFAEATNMVLICPACHEEVSVQGMWSH